MKKTNEVVVAVKEVAETKVVRSVAKIAFLAPIIEAGETTGKELEAALKTAFPQMTEVTIKTLVVDLKNPKYSIFKDRMVVKGEDGKLRFA